MTTLFHLMTSLGTSLMIYKIYFKYWFKICLNTTVQRNVSKYINVATLPKGLWNLVTRSYLQDSVYIISWNIFYENVYKKEEIINIVNEWEMISLSILIYVRQNTVIMNYASILITNFHSNITFVRNTKSFFKRLISNFIIVFLVPEIIFDNDNLLIS